MAEIAGLVGGVALASLFSTCMEAFDYIRACQNLGKDYQEFELKLEVAKRRLLDWGDSLRILANQRNSAILPAHAKLRTIKDLLENIAGTLEEAKQISVKMELKPGSKRFIEDLSSPGSSNDNIENLVMRFRNWESTSLTLWRQKHQDQQSQATFGRKIVWALHDRRQYSDLVKQVTGYIDDLDKLFPATFQVLQQRCFAQAIQLLGPNPREAEVVAMKEAAHGVYPVMESVVHDIHIQGHSFRNIRAEGHSLLQNGDQIAAGQQALGYGHSYNGIVSTGNAKVLNGNTVGCRSFWD